ncbi:MAG: hypothetical protein HOI35_06065 [Woeseia sp.]|nr:hypothetical protein [Woeseia sp.]
MGTHDDGHVDAYFGAETIREAANREQLSLVDIASRSQQLRGELEAQHDRPDVNIEPARLDGLLGRLTALETRVALKQGKSFSFDDESVRLFGAAAPDHDAAHFQVILDEIDHLIGGEGNLAQRVNDFRDQFVLPRERLSVVFDAAINECRRRTLQYIALPHNESFSIEYVNDKPWSGYNWYQGSAQSLIQINTDLPIYISRAVDLGCHEGYPGHHTFNALLEKNLVQEKGWNEFSIYPLFSPQSLIAEGSGNYGIELAFPDNERITFEKDVLFPLAGLDAAEADRYYQLQALITKLEYSGNEAARDYLNGTIDRDQAVQWMVDYSLSSPERARKHTEFFDAYRSYVINYNLGKDLVRDYVELDTSDAAARWARFEALLSSPITAATLDLDGS